ncbi:MAG: histidine kinase [Chloroflexi bacterium RBG_13_50_10]|nr:MAG: histidine kinase [Chloroflexi bacterium RBG_13_50_10]
MAEKRKEILKRLLKKLHEGADPEQIKEEFKRTLGDVPATEIAQVEEELIKEGTTREQIQKFCDIHLAVLKESLDKEKAIAPAGHPVNILMEEHKMLLKFADEFKNVSQKVKKAKGFDLVSGSIEQLGAIAEHFKESESHYIREENVLFPSLEKHGIKEPPAVMWMEHDKIREIEKKFYGLMDKRGSIAFQGFAEQLGEVALALAEMLSSHFYKENNILFPAALQVIGESEWVDIRRQFDELGYCCFTPEPAKAAIGKGEAPVSKHQVKGMVSFETGALSGEELEALLNTLPVDVTFVDKDDTVRYFSQSKDRLFPRAKAIIGLKVQNCHPQKSVHIVNQILEDFRTGKQDVAQFWINMKGRLIYIRYFAVRKGGHYLGCLEVTQDIADIKKIEGEKRLLEY